MKTLVQILIKLVLCTNSNACMLEGGRFSLWRQAIEPCWYLRLQLNSDTINPEISIRFHSLRVQPYKTVSLLQTPVASPDSYLYFWLAIGWRFPWLPPWVWLIYSSSSEFREAFYSQVHWFFKNGYITSNSQGKEWSRARCVVWVRSFRGKPLPPSPPFFMCLLTQKLFEPVL